MKDDGRILTINDFQPGTVHSVNRVAKFLDVCGPTVIRMIRDGRLDGKQAEGSAHFFISGESVRIFYGSLQLKQDLSQPEKVESVDENVAAKRALKDLQKLSRSKQTKQR